MKVLLKNGQHVADVVEFKDMADGTLQFGVLWRPEFRSLPRDYCPGDDYALWSDGHTGDGIDGPVGIEVIQLKETSADSEVGVRATVTARRREAE